MGGYYINVNLKTDDAARVREAVIDASPPKASRCSGRNPPHGRGRRGRLPDGDDWYGVLVSGAAGTGLGLGLRGRLAGQRLTRQAPVAVALSSGPGTWVADDIHWGYNYYENGEVRDRFADDPSQVAESEEEAALYQGRAEAAGSRPASPAGSVREICCKTPRASRAVRGRAAGCTGPGGRPAVRARLHRLRLLLQRQPRRLQPRIWKTGPRSGIWPSSRRRAGRRWRSNLYGIICRGARG